MNPMMAMIGQMMKGGGSPQQFIQGMMNNSQAMQNPILKNALQMAQKGDRQGVEQLARNLCNEKGINPEEAIGKIKSQFGMN